MRSRGFRICMLLGVALWFGVVVPGHERGLVKVPGARPEAPCPAHAQGRGHCHAAHGDPAEGPDERPTDDASHCAVCRFLATLGGPAAPPTPPEALADAGPAPADRPAAAPAIEHASPFQRRGPPHAA